MYCDRWDLTYQEYEGSMYLVSLTLKCTKVQCITAPDVVIFNIN